MTALIKQDLLSDEKQNYLLFSLAPEDSDHPPERVAAYIGGSSGTLSNLRNLGGGPKFRRVGGRILYRKRDVMAWIEANPTVTSLTELSRLREEQSRHAA